ncbi:MAG: hypothetical protein FWH05_09635 [Oscillospiraceae bacterium]|nr:hypothetical protein [Oscillospiraceae bacterium]
MTIIESPCGDGFKIITATPPGSYVLGGGWFFLECLAEIFGWGGERGVLFQK